MLKTGFCIALSLALAACQGLHISHQTTETASLAKHKPQVYQGEISGYDSIDYFIDVKVGDNLQIMMESPFPTAYFNLNAPNQNEAIFVGAMQGEQYKGTIKTAGRYRVRVYLMRSQARKKIAVPYKLTINIQP